MEFLTIPSYHIKLNDKTGRFIPGVGVAWALYDSTFFPLCSGALARSQRQAAMEQNSNDSAKRLTLYTAREAAGYLRVSLSTLNRMERRGLLVPLRTPGGHRRYTLEMLNEVLTRGQTVLEEK